VHLSISMSLSYTHRTALMELDQLVTSSLPLKYCLLYHTLIHVDDVSTDCI
jgi:hypothetical protein